MNRTIKDYYNNGQLVLAAYSELNENQNNSDYRKALSFNGADFSTSQANKFISQYKIIEDQPNINKGFSATLFQDTEEGEEYTLAIRGTDQIIDSFALTNLADIGDDGIALNQVIGLFNFYQKLITPANKKAIQLDLYEGPIAPDPGVLNQVLREARPRMGTPRQYRYLRVVDSVDGLGAIRASGA